MFLSRVTLTGFKSFAGRTVLDLEPGITGVVGPNGSGKSNLADAIRWALGEQSKQRLRLSDREEVVFAGTQKRAKASYAEVTLLFDNQDGKFPLDLTEVEISRRLYRSGETDYRLAGRSIRLGDIQALLAEAGFGTSTYTVIGQGMIDSFLVSSPAERKQLFDEAAGIRGPELGRDAALRKLSATSLNLTRLRDISAELVPRLASLEHAVGAVRERRELENQIVILKNRLAVEGAAHWSRRASDLHGRISVSESSMTLLKKEIRDHQDELAKLASARSDTSARQQELQASLSALEVRRDQLGAELAEIRAQITLAHGAGAQADDLHKRLQEVRRNLDAERGRLSDLQSELSSNTAAGLRAAAAVTQAAHGVAEAQAALVAVRQNTRDGTRDQYVDNALQILKTLALAMGKNEMSIDQIKLLVHKAGRLLSHASHSGALELVSELKAAQKKLEAAMGKRETAVEHQTNVTITIRSVEMDITHLEDSVGRFESQIKQIQTEHVAAQTAAANLIKLEASLQKTATALESVTKDLDAGRDKLGDLSAQSETAGREAEVAATLERKKAALQTAEAETSGLKQELEAAKNNLRQAQARADQAATSDSEAPADDVTADSLEELEAKLLRAETLLEARGQAEAGQAQEYEEVKARYDELTQQINDLETAGTDLETVITGLDKLIQQRFEENFESLGRHFSEYFERLFKGGAASLELQKAEDGTFGIVVKASPKGRRLTNLAALSGGERALAGVALLAAILRVNPSPFVVLDEIDAALDEPNSARLSEILTELGANTQLIVITHNRQTMNAARVLFGVTTGEHHSSHLLSMRLEEAAQLAAR